MTDYPHVPAAFINAISEEGTMAEAIAYLQKQWNESCALRAELKALRGVAAGCVDAIALDAAHQIEALPSDLREAQKTARIQLIVLDAMRGSAATPTNGETLYRRFITADRIWYEPVSQPAAAPTTCARTGGVCEYHTEPVKNDK